MRYRANISWLEGMLSCLASLANKVQTACKRSGVCEIAPLAERVTKKVEKMYDFRFT